MKPRLARIRTARFLFGSAATGSASRFSAPLPRNFFTSARQAPSATPLHQSALLFFRLQRSALGRRFQALRLKSDKPTYQSHNPTPHLGSPDPAPSISQRLKQLSREYGWTAVGVYFALSLVDFPLCFVAVRLLGTDRIGHYEEVIKAAFWNVVRLAFPDAGKKPAEPGADEDVAEATAREGYVEAGRAVGHNGGSDACMETQISFSGITTSNRNHSNLDPARSSLPCPQVPNLLPCATYRSCPSQGCQDSEELGV